MTSHTPTKQINDLIADMITRTMRQGGFTGDVIVTNIRARKDGSYSASVEAVVGGGMGRVNYRATVAPGPGGIKVTRVGEPVFNIPEGFGRKR